MLLLLNILADLSVANGNVSVKYPPYRPCRSFSYYPAPLKLECNANGWNEPSGDDVVQAFRRNDPNYDIQSLSIVGTEYNHMVTEANLNEIFQLIAKGSAETIKEIYLSDLDMTRLPESINNFKNLEKLTARNFKEIVRLGPGFINLRDLPNLRTLNLMKNRILTIDPNAFQG